MAGTLLRFADQQISEFACDTAEEVAYLPTTEEDGTNVFSRFKKAKIGSTCIVGNEDGDLLVYMLFSFGWKQI